MSTPIIDRLSRRRSSTLFTEGEERTCRIAKLGKAASPWSRIPLTSSGIRTLRLEMIRDVSKGKKPRSFR